jgi:hypothetical protein
MQKTGIFLAAAILATPFLALMPTPSVSQTPAPSVPQKVVALMDIKANFGATGNGKTDDSQAFRAFNAWALNWQQTHAGLIELYMPAGTYLYGGSYSPSPFQGIKELLVYGYGATLTVNFMSATGSTAPYGIFLGGAATYTSNGHSARVASVVKGSTQVKLLNPANVTLFKVGNFALMAGIDLMGYGYPINPYYFQYLQITGINPTGLITFSNPLANSYESTWPHYNSGGASTPDEGGPATLYQLDPSWDTQVEYRGLTFSMPTTEITANGRSITFTDVTFANGCPIPSQNETWTANNITIPPSNLLCSNIEADKIVDNLIYNGGTINSIIFQSSSINHFTMTGTNVNGDIVGTPKNTVISNSNIAGFLPGVTGFGATSSITCLNSNITSMSGVYGVVEPLIGTNYAYTINNGVFAVPNSHLPVRWAVPGARIFWGSGVGGPGPEGGPFIVTDLTQDANNTYVNTTLPSAYSNIISIGNIGARGDPVPRFTFKNCIGSVEANDLSGAPPDKPIYSYSKRTYSGVIGTAGNLVAQPYFPIWGQLVSIKINVIKPDTGGNNTLSLDMPILAMRGTTEINYTPTINLMKAGERIITPTGIGGAQPGDILGTSPVGDLWLTLTRAFLSGDISKDPASTTPVVTVEMTTTQCGIGVTPGTVWTGEIGHGCPGTR